MKKRLFIIFIFALTFISPNISFANIERLNDMDDILDEDLSLQAEKGKRRVDSLKVNTAEEDSGVENGTISKIIDKVMNLFTSKDEDLDEIDKELKNEFKEFDIAQDESGLSSKLDIIRENMVLVIIIGVSVIVFFVIIYLFFYKIRRLADQAQTSKDMSEKYYFNMQDSPTDFEKYGKKSNTKEDDDGFDKPKEDKISKNKKKGDDKLASVDNKNGSEGLLGEDVDSDLLLPNDKGKNNGNSDVNSKKSASDEDSFIDGLVDDSEDKTDADTSLLDEDDDELASILDNDADSDKKSSNDSGDLDLLLSDDREDDFLLGINDDDEDDEGEGEVGEVNASQGKSDNLLDEIDDNVVIGEDTGLEDLLDIDDGGSDGGSGSGDDSDEDDMLLDELSDDSDVKGGQLSVETAAGEEGSLGDLLQEESSDGDEFLSLDFDDDETTENSGDLDILSIDEDSEESEKSVEDVLISDLASESVIEDDEELDLDDLVDEDSGGNETGGEESVDGLEDLLLSDDNDGGLEDEKTVSESEQTIELGMDVRDDDSGEGDIEDLFDEGSESVEAGSEELLDGDDLELLDDEEDLLDDGKDLIVTEEDDADEEKTEITNNKESLTDEDLIMNSGLADEDFETSEELVVSEESGGDNVESVESIVEHFLGDDEKDNEEDEISESDELELFGEENELGGVEELVATEDDSLEKGSLGSIMNEELVTETLSSDDILDEDIETVGDVVGGSVDELLVSEDDGKAESLGELEELEELEEIEVEGDESDDSEELIITEADSSKEELEEVVEIVGEISLDDVVEELSFDGAKVEESLNLSQSDNDEQVIVDADEIEISDNSDDEELENKEDLVLTNDGSFTAVSGVVEENDEDFEVIKGKTSEPIFFKKIVKNAPGFNNIVSFDHSVDSDYVALPSENRDVAGGEDTADGIVLIEGVTSKPFTEKADVSKNGIAKVDISSKIGQMLRERRG